jgi:hypothetical protein
VRQGGRDINQCVIVNNHGCDHVWESFVERRDSSEPPGT